MILKNIRHRIRLGAQLLKLMYRHDVLVEWAVTVKYVDSISFGRHCTLQSGVYLYGSRSGRSVTFGDSVAVSSGGMLLGEGGLDVGDYTHFGPRVVVTTQYGDSDSDMLQQDASLKYLPVRIGKGCWIGSGSVIMPGAVLGDRCIVAPNSVVYGNWPAGARLSGSPARAERAARA
jgi:acetyltransferase-like isoleucine patch superfamily enzyme